MEAREKARQEKERRLLEEKLVRMQQLAVISEESDHSWKKKKQARTAIRILDKRLTMADAADWNQNDPASSAAKKADNSSLFSLSDRSDIKSPRSPLEEMADAAEKKDDSLFTLSSAAKQ